MTTAVLELRDLRVSFGERTILDGIDLAVGPGQITVITGPGGAGKSTLLRTICGENEGNPSMTVEGQVQYRGQRPESSHQPVLVEQTPAKMMRSVFELIASHTPDRALLTRQQLRDRLCDQLNTMRAGRLVEQLDESLIELAAVDRRLAMLVAGVVRDPAVLCVDEPTAGLDDEDAEQVLELLRLQADHRAILWVTHHQRRARSIADRVALLAGGRICEKAQVDQFFDAPVTPEARSFVRSGSCTIASPDARPEELAPQFRQANGSQQKLDDVVLLEPGDEQTSAKPSAPSARRGPIGFHWMRPGQLAGTPMPGAMRPIEEDLAALQRVGVTVLVTLTMEPLPLEPLQPLSMQNLHVPMPDMGVPTLEKAAECCWVVSEYLDRDETVAFHCRAGIGRTGTMLAVYEIWDGMSADDAFAAARSVHRRWIQSQRQKRFLTEFEQWLE